MQNGFKLAPGASIREHPAAQGGAIQNAACLEYRFTESRSNRFERRALEGGQLACDDIGIDYRHAAFGESVCNRRLARTDSSGEADREHQNWAR